MFSFPAIDFTAWEGIGERTMSQLTKIFVNIYCELTQPDTFSNEMCNKEATGNEIYEFLMRDAQLCIDGFEMDIVSGDCNIWYLGCTYYSGHIQYNQKSWDWDKSKSSFDIVEEFVSSLYADNLITEKQFKTLIDKVNEGRFIGNTTDIKNYLLRRNAGRPFIPDSRIMANYMKMRRKENQRSE